MKKYGKPTVPNRTGKSTASDDVQTKVEIAKIIVNHYNISGEILEPCKGKGNIYNLLPDPKNWCEIKEGKDFFDWEKRVDWIVTNLPYSIYDRFLEHCFNIADNVVLLVPIAKAFKSMKIERMVGSKC